MPRAWNRQYNCFGLSIWRLLLTGLAFIMVFSIHLSIEASLRDKDGDQWVATQELGPNIHYGLIVDAGSSGSRLHIYIWPPHSGDAKELLQLQPLRNEAGEPIQKKITPGLSHLSEHPSQATEYMVPLLQFAAAHIPIEKHKETPLFILATAGMRLLDKSTQEAILDNLRTDIPRNFSFLFPEGNVEVISGKQEGIYQWLAINFVLGRLVPRNDALHPTAGIIDMGGASLQIAFQVPEGNVKTNAVDVNIGSQSETSYFQYSVYVNTFLGFGANEQFSLQRKYTLKRAQNLTVVNGKRLLKDDCLPKGLKENVTHEEVVHQLTGTGNWDLCTISLASYIKSSECGNGSSCVNSGLPINGMERLHFYGFSEFWYTMEDIFRLGGLYSYEKLRNVALEFCRTEWSVLYRRYKDGLYPKADEDRMKNQCFKSAWLSAVVHHLFHFPASYNLLSSTPNDVGGQVVAWTLGALLYKTRFFPLRSIEKVHPPVWLHSIVGGPKVYYSHGLLVLCVFLIMMALYVFMRQLNRYSKYGSFHRVPSYSDHILTDVR